MLYSETVLLLSNNAFRILKDEHLVEDLIQDLFVDIYIRRDQISAEINIVGYLNNAVKYKSGSVLRSHLTKNRMVLLTDEINDFAATDPDPIEHKELQAELENNINTLPQKCRKAFMLNYIDQLSYKEISREMKISIKTVEKHMSKALRMLRNSRWTNYG